MGTDAAPATDSRRNVLWTLGANLVLAGLAAVSGVALARLLGPTVRGEVAAIQLWGTFVGALASLGVQEAVVYFTARRRSDAGRYLASGMVLNALTPIPFVVAGWFLIPVVLAAQRAEVHDLARLFLLAIPLYNWTGYPGASLRALGSFSVWNLLRVLPSLGWVVVIVAAWWAGTLTPRVLTVGYLAMLAVVLVVAVVLAARVVPGPYAVDVGTWSPMLRFGVPGMLSTVPQTLNVRLDQMLLAAVVGAEDLGLYVAAVAWAGVLAPVLSALGPVLFPRLASEADEHTRVTLFWRAVRGSVVVAAALVAVVSALTPIAVRLLFGEAFVDAVPAAMVLVVASAVLSLNLVVADGWRGLGRPVEVLIGEAAGLVATVLALAVLLPALGIVGAAVASLVGYGLTMVVMLVRVGRRYPGAGIANAVPGPADLREVWRSARAALSRSSTPSAA